MLLCDLGHGGKEYHPHPNYNMLLYVLDHKVKEYHPHPKYNATSKKDKGIAEFFDFDVALIELKEDVQISPMAR